MKHPQPNRLLRATRERSGRSRTALAEAVSLWLAQRDPRGRDVAFDANHLGKIERGIIERPRANYVAALCAILRATESELGFDHSSRATPEDVDRKAFLQAALGVGAGAMLARSFPVMTQPISWQQFPAPLLTTAECRTPSPPSS